MLLNGIKVYQKKSNRFFRVLPFSTPLGTGLLKIYKSITLNDHLF